MEKLLNAWDVKTLWAAYNIHIRLANAGKTVEDLKKYLDDYVPAKSLKDIKNNPKPKKDIIHKKCPICGKNMKFTTMKDNEKYKAKWECCSTCMGTGCGYIEYIE